MVKLVLMYLRNEFKILYSDTSLRYFFAHKFKVSSLNYQLRCTWHWTRHRICGHRFDSNDSVSRSENRCSVECIRPGRYSRFRRAMETLK